MSEPLERVLRHLGVANAVPRLAELSGPDLTTLLLEVMRERAAIEPSRLLSHYRDDRFMPPAAITPAEQAATEQALLSALPADVDQIVLSPVVPLGSHHFAGVDQNNVLSTVRRSEVAADPTMGLALEAAARRRADRELPTRLAATQRIVRAQPFEGELSSSHFALLGFVTAGRSAPGHGFEAAALAEHGAALATGCLNCGADGVTVDVTDWTGGYLAGVPDAIQEAVSDDRLVVDTDDSRQRAHGYYSTGAVLVHASFGGDTFEVGDGGFVDWTQRLLADSKERLMTSGLGIDRLAIGRRATGS